ncbi:gephyrin-like molybdotransferase Glp [Picosynechococcus sp. PCC 7117]|uniref:molybdopterin molybdotransferase MoeA n=1 Tax=Picosynechococcus sp. PCC 7117 TaxID=195498 RepID=UPI0008103CAA|nr:gephyrin-like molybdotransferase Glp [Picosynechococcus sp. PCC 7117]ANV86689.1 molybdopterin molybdenumtransferase [Picosynechococcus sp. PCC 7117]
MISVDQAQALILQAIAPLGETEPSTLETALGRILATTVTGKLDIPHWDNSAMDGYAIRFADLEEEPVELEIIETIPAGQAPQKSLASGQAARIFTGAMLPTEADTVVMQEHTEQRGDRVKILQNPSLRQFVRQRGDYYRAGEPLLKPGQRLGAADLAVLAACQCVKFPVYRQPRVAIFSTGDELRSPQEKLEIGQIVDSNRYGLTAFVQGQRAIPKNFGIVPDDPAQLKATMEKAIAAGDLILSTGGVSVGEFDYVEKLLEELGGEIFIRSVAIRPGKPLTVAKFPGNKLYFGLPGNPVSALVGCWRFVQPALKKLSGDAGPWAPEFVWATCDQPLKGAGKRDAYLWGTLVATATGYLFHLAGGGHSSANLVNLAQTNALAIVPQGTGEIPAGDRLRVMRLQT